MGKTIARTRAVRNVSDELAELKKLSASPVENIGKIREVMERLHKEKLDSVKRSQFFGVELEIYRKLTDKERTLLYTYPILKPLDVSKVTDARSAQLALKSVEKDPVHYLPQIREIFNRFNEEATGKELRGKIMLSISIAQMEYVNSKPLTAIPEIKLKTTTKLSDQELWGGKLGKYQTGSAGLSVNPASAGLARPTDIELLPRQPRMASTPLYKPSFELSTKTAQILGISDAKKGGALFSDMFMGYFKGGDPVSGSNFYNLIIDRVDSMTGNKYKGQALDPAKPPQQDMRWNMLVQILGAYNPTDQNNRQQMLDVLNKFKSGDFLNGLKALPDQSPLKNMAAQDIAAMCSKMYSETPISVLSAGFDLTGYKLLDARLTLGAGAFFSWITSAQYQPEFNQNTFELKMRYTGTTSARTAVRGGGFARYNMYGNATAEIRVSGEALQGANEPLGQPMLVLDATITDPSGNLKIPFTQLPIYWALRFSMWPTENAAMNVNGALGVGVANFKGVPLILLSDLGIDFRRGELNTPKPISNYLMRVGAGATFNLNGKPFPVKAMFIKGWSSEPTELGIKNESLIGGALEAKLQGWSFGAGLEKRDMVSVSGLPLEGGNNILFNAYIFKDFDFYDWITRKRK